MADGTMTIDQGTQQGQQQQQSQGQQQGQQQQQGGTQQQGGEKLFAGKYKSVEELEKGYTELSKKLGDGSKPPAVETRDDLTIKPPQIDPEDLDIDDILNRAKLKGEDLAKEYEKSGRLTDAQYAAIRAEVGNVPKKIIDGYIRGNFAEAQLVQNVVSQSRIKATEIAGGESQLETLRTWARDGGIPADELAELNATVKLRPQFYPTMIRIIAQRHAEAVGAGKAQALVGGTQASSPTSKPKTREEFAKMMIAVGEQDVSALEVLKTMSMEEISAFER